MKVEVTIDKHKKLPDGAIPALEQELLRRLSQSYDDCKLTIRRTSNDGLSVLGGADGDKKRVEQILQETCIRRQLPRPHRDNYSGLFVI
ncbi:DinI family protein [Klebsiella pneumoniae]|uniref:DinI-like family protein n=2 Tax=Klebsiella pneumoniae TaxID=573 RepID=UPI000E2C8C3B|nr:DinI-like family protein [Klebsiella pneumoniae]SWR02013.1 DinI family protein [Klebsiella pneumoniae]